MSKSNSSNNDQKIHRNQKVIEQHLNFIFDEAEETLSHDKNKNRYVLGPFVSVDSIYSLRKLATNYWFSLKEKLGLGMFKVGLLILGSASLLEDKHYNFWKSFDEVWALFSSLFALFYFLFLADYCRKSLIWILEFMVFSLFVACLYLATLDVLIYWEKRLETIQIIFGWFLYKEVKLKQIF